MSFDLIEEIVKKESEKKDMVQKQIQDINKKIEEILGSPINQELWDLIQSLIIKTNQYHKLSMNELKSILSKEVKPIIDKYKDDLGI